MHHPLNGQRLARAGVFGDDTAVLVGHQLVAAEHDLLHLVVAADLDRGGMESEHDAPVAGPRLTFGVTAQHLKVVSLGLARGIRLLAGNAGQVGRVDNHVDALETFEIAEFAQLQRGESRL